MRHAPGQKLLALARRVLPRDETDRVIEPAIADLQHEWSASWKLSFSEQLAVRTRAYLGAVRVIGLRLVIGSAHAILELPPRPLASRFLWVSVILVATLSSTYAYLDRQRVGEHWLFYVPDYAARSLPILPLLWVSWFGRGPLGGPAITPRARDVAKLTLALAAAFLIFTGWISPILRQQYLIALNLSEFATAAVHQWTLDQLIAGLSEAQGISSLAIAAELQKRTIDVGLIVLFGACGWLDVKATSIWSRKAGLTLALSGPILCASLLALSSALASPQTQFLVNWLSIMACLALTVTGLRVIARVERSRRPELEAKALALLQALPKARQAELLQR